MEIIHLLRRVDSVMNANAVTQTDPEDTAISSSNALTMIDSLLGHSSYKLNNPLGVYNFQLLDMCFSLRSRLSCTPEQRFDWIGRIESIVQKPITDVLHRPISEIKKRRVPLPPIKLLELDEQCTKRISRLPGRSIRDKLAAKKKHYGVVRIFDSNLIEYAVVKKTVKLLNNFWRNDFDTSRIPEWISKANNDSLLKGLKWNKPLKANNRLRRDRRFGAIWRGYKNLQRHNEITSQRELNGSLHTFTSLLRLLMVTSLFDHDTTLSPAMVSINFETLEISNTPIYLSKNSAEFSTRYLLTKIISDTNDYSYFDINVTLNDKISKSFLVGIRLNSSGFEVSIDQFEYQCNINSNNTIFAESLLCCVDELCSFVHKKCNLPVPTIDDAIEPWWNPNSTPQVIDLASSTVRVYGEEADNHNVKLGICTLISPVLDSDQEFAINGLSALHASKSDISGVTTLHCHQQLDDIVDQRISTSIMHSVSGQALNKCKIIIPDGLTQRGQNNIRSGLPPCSIPAIFIPKSAAIMSASGLFSSELESNYDIACVISEYRDRVEITWFENEVKSGDTPWVRHYPKVEYLKNSKENTDRNEFGELLPLVDEEFIHKAIKSAIDNPPFSTKNKKLTLLINSHNNQYSKHLTRLIKVKLTGFSCKFILDEELTEAVSTLSETPFPWSDLMPKLKLRTSGQLISLFEKEERVQIGQSIYDTANQRFVLKKGSSRVRLELVEERSRDLGNKLFLLAEWDKPSLNEATVTINTDFVYGCSDWNLTLEIQDAELGRSTGLPSHIKLITDTDSREEIDARGKNIGPDVPMPTKWNEDDSSKAANCIQHLDKTIHQFNTFLKSVKGKQSSNVSQSSLLANNIVDESKKLRNLLKGIEEEAKTIWSPNRITKLPDSEFVSLKKLASLKLLNKNTAFSVPKKLIKNHKNIEQEIQKLTYRTLIARSRIRSFSSNEEKVINKFLKDGLNFATVQPEIWNASCLVLSRLMPESWDDSWATNAKTLCECFIDEIVELPYSIHQKQITILSILILVRSTPTINDNTDIALFEVINRASIALLENSKTRSELLLFARIHLGLMSRRQTIHDQFVNIEVTSKLITQLESKIVEVDWKSSTEDLVFSEEICTHQNGMEYLVAVMNGTADIVELAILTDEVNDE